MPGESYRRRLRSLLYLCCVFRKLFNPLVFWFRTNTLGWTRTTNSILLLIWVIYEDMRMYLYWSLWTMYWHACQMTVTVGDSGLCCTCVAYFESYLTPLCVDSERALWASFCFRSVIQLYHGSNIRYSSTFRFNLWWRGEKQMSNLVRNIG